jgi:cold shock CspA family protein
VREYDLSEPTNDDKLLGEIMRYDPDRGYGFIRCTSEPDMRNPFLHVTAMVSKDDIENLGPGMRVAFNVTDTPRGPRATDIELVQ